MPISALLLVLFFLNACLATAQVPVEYHVKAVFLFRFAQFVEWPPSVFATRESPIVLGVLGSNPFGDALTLATRGETVYGRRLVVRQFKNVQEIDSCQILFISASEAPRIPSILATLKGRSILSVSDIENFIDLGGMIQFITVENGVQFRINRKTAEAEKLRVSSKLLQIAR